MKSNFVGCDNRSGYRSLAIDICRVGNIRPENFVKVTKIATPVFLTIAYDYYYSICLNKDILKRNGTSGNKSMDTFLNILSNISNRTVKPEELDFDEDDNDVSNDLIEDFKNYKIMLEQLNRIGCDSEDVEKLMEIIESGTTRELISFKTNAIMYYSSWCTAILNYWMGRIEINDLKKEFVVPSISKMKYRPSTKGEVIKFVRSLIKLRNLFYSVRDGRAD